MENSAHRRDGATKRRSERLKSGPPAARPWTSRIFRHREQERDSCSAETRSDEHRDGRDRPEHRPRPTVPVRCGASGPSPEEVHGAGMESGTGFGIRLFLTGVSPELGTMWHTRPASTGQGSPPPALRGDTAMVAVRLWTDGWKTREIQQRVMDGITGTATFSTVIDRGFMCFSAEAGANMRTRNQVSAGLISSRRRA